MKDIQACSRESVKGTLATRPAQTLSVFQAKHTVLHGKPFMHIYAPHTHTHLDLQTHAHKEIAQTLKCKSN